MKFLRNPIVSGILAVIAICVLAYQFSGGAMARYKPAGLTKRVVAELVAATTPAPVPAPAPPPTQPAEVSGTTPDAAIDRGFLEARFAKWVAAPFRDPFLLFVTDTEKVKEEKEFESPIARWKLQGIWDQTGGKLAVINNRVHKIGDEIEGYKILRIEGDEVWFQGPKRKERLALERRGPAVVPNPVFLPATTVPANSVPQ